MPQVSPTVLTWARETAGLTRAEAARKLQLGEAHGMAPAERLAALEAGDGDPTRSMLGRMARQYRQPLVAFYLDEPPRRSAAGTDFRTLTGRTSTEQDALVRTLVRDAIARQRIVRDQLEDEDAEAVAFIGTVAMSDGLQPALQALRDVVGKASAGRPPGFDDLRDAVEQAGVYVLLQGNLGSHHTALETSAFRGFALADPLAPFIVINSNDARAAWSFTLLHEMVHLLLGQTGISGADSESATERFCNDVASEFLLPSSAVEAFASPGLAEDSLVEALGELSKKWKVSHALIAYRLYRSGKIDAASYNALSMVFRRRWEQERGRRNTGDVKVDYYTVKRHRLGAALLRLAERGLAEGTLPTTKAAVALGVKPTQVGPVLRISAPA